MKKMKYILIIAAVVIALGIVFFLVRKSAPVPDGYWEAVVETMRLLEAIADK